MDHIRVTFKGPSKNGKGSRLVATLIDQSGTLRRVTVALEHNRSLDKEVIDAAAQLLRQSRLDAGALFTSQLPFPKIIGGKTSSTTWIFFFEKYALKF